MEMSIEVDATGFMARISKMDAAVKGKVHEKTKSAAYQVELLAKHRARKQYGFLRASIGHVDTSFISGSPPRAPPLVGIWIEEFADIELGSGLAYAWAMEHYMGTPAYSAEGAYSASVSYDEYGGSSSRKGRQPRTHRGPP